MDLSEVWKFIKEYGVVFTIGLGSLTLILGTFFNYRNYSRNKRIDKESKAQKEKDLKEAKEESERKSHFGKQMLNSMKQNNLPKFGTGESTFTVADTTMEHYLHNFGKTASNFNFVPVNAETCYITMDPRGVTTFDQFSKITIHLRGKGNLDRAKLNYEYELHFEDVLGTKYKQVVKGTMINGFTISLPIEIKLNSLLQ